MRTTLNLPDALVEAVRARATAEGRTFTSVLEEALRGFLARGPATAEPVKLPTFGDPDGQLLVDLSDRDAVWAALDADGPR